MAICRRHFDPADASSLKSRLRYAITVVIWSICMNDSIEFTMNLSMLDSDDDFFFSPSSKGFSSSSAFISSKIYQVLDYINLN